MSRASTTRAMRWPWAPPMIPTVVPTMAPSPYHRSDRAIRLGPQPARG
jgi:hypothetical protein